LLNPPAVDGLKTISTACHRNWVTFFMQIELGQQLPGKLSHCLSATVAIKSTTSIVYGYNCCIVLTYTKYRSRLL